MRPARPALRRAGRAALTVVAAAAILVIPGGAAVSAPEPAVLVSPTTDGNTAVQAGQSVEVSGTAPADSQPTSARLIGLLRDGSAAGVQKIDLGTLGATDDPVRGGDYLRVDDGQFDGRLTLDCLFADPSPPESPGRAYSCPDRTVAVTAVVRDVVLEVTVGGQTLRSPPLRVDFTRPRFRDAQLVAPDRILARLSEPVRYPALQPELPADWEVRVDGRPVTVTRVDGPTPGDCTGVYQPGEDTRAGDSGCTRTLVLDTAAIDEDAQPVVDYVLVDDRVPGRTAYLDLASNRLFHLGTGTRTAVDEIRPPTPRIESVAGRAPADGRVDANVAAPVLSLSNLKAGHSAFARITSGGTVRETAPVQASGATLELQLPDLGEDRDHRIEAVAVDPHGNRSTDAGEPAREDGAPSSVVYGLDTVAPFLLGALAEPDGALTVTISEEVDGTDSAGHWQLQSGRAVTDVSGSGGVRQLTVDGGAVAGDLLSYAPGDGRYSDPAGNALANATVPVAGVPAPVVQVPAAVLYTNDPAAEVAGTGRDGDVVEVFRDADRNGTPDGAPVGDATVAGDQWSVQVPLADNAVNDLLVQAREGQGRSPYATVPRIVHDTVAPALDVVAPTSADVLAGGSATDVEWRTGDAHHGEDAAVQVELTVDGTEFTVVDPGAPAGEGSTSVVLPAVSTDTARVRLSTTDLAGNTATALSGVFRIDATDPVFIARTVEPRLVEVTFSEPVSGPLGPDWRVDGQPAAVERADGSPAVRADGATTLLLRTTADFDPDSTPQVVYDPAAAPLTGELVDEAGRPVPPGLRTVTAADRIRPAAPTVTAVDGKAPSSDRVLSNEPRPVVSVSGMRAGNDVVVQLATADGGRQGERTRATGSTADATSPLVPADGEHRMQAVAVDPAGNTSTDASLRPPSADGDAEVTYLLDTVAPAAVAADPQEDDVRVAFSEVVTGPDSAGDWSFTGADGTPRAVTDVSGEGAARLLSVQGGALAGGVLSYAPTGDRYSDAAGNVVEDAQLVVGGVPVPVVLTPSTPLITNDDVVTIEGGGEPGTVVELLREGSDAVLDAETVAPDGRWSVSAPLQKNTENRLVVRGKDASSGDRSSAVPVPVITQDSIAPSLELREPTGGELYARDAEAVVRWASDDAHHAPDGMRVELTLDGRTWRVLDPAAAPGDDEGSVDWTVPAVDTRSAKVRVTATDLAGNSTVRTSDAFRIDAVLPRFGAKTLGERSVLVRFTEPVHGTLAPSDFLVDGAPAVVERSDSGVGAAAVRADGVRELRLATTASIGPNDRPTVQYAPSPLGEATDEAGNPITERLVIAVDGIVPAAPKVSSPAAKVYERDVRRAYSGTSEVGTTVRLVAESGGAASGAVRTSSEGTWRAVGQLRRDAEVRLRAVAVDDAGNVSPLTTAPPVVQDSLAPAAAVLHPRRGQQLPLDTDVDVSWQVRDANLVKDKVLVEVTTDGGRTWRAIGRDQASEGELVWRTPAQRTSIAAVRVTAVDRAGRLGARTEGWIGVGTAASASSPPPSSSSGQQPAVDGSSPDEVDVEYSLPDRVRGALPRTGAELLRVVLYGVVFLLTGAGFLLAGRNHRRMRRRRAG